MKILNRVCVCACVGVSVCVFCFRHTIALGIYDENVTDMFVLVYFGGGANCSSCTLYIDIVSSVVIGHQEG